MVRANLGTQRTPGGARAKHLIGSDLASRRAAPKRPEQMWCERTSARSILWRCVRDFATMCPLLSALAVEREHSECRVRAVGFAQLHTGSCAITCAQTYSRTAAAQWPHSGRTVAAQWPHSGRLYFTIVWARVQRSKESRSIYIYNVLEMFRGASRKLL